MQTVICVFERRADAERALATLSERGVNREVMTWKAMGRSSKPPADPISVTIDVVSSRTCLATCLEPIGRMKRPITTKRFDVATPSWRWTLPPFAL